MLVTRVGDIECGVIPRAIGGPYSVLIAEQLHAAGARLIVGLTSAGRIAPTLRADDRRLARDLLDAI